jgi:glyoxylase-like metal-dependent hydrolase (beta-lactamase superfamily II)
LVLIGSTALVLVAAVIGSMRGFRPAAAPAQELLRQAPVTVAPGVHLLGQLSPAAAYVVETSAGLVLIDSGVQPDATSLLQQLTRLHLDVERLQAILLTHVHADHSLGAQYLRQRTGARIYAGRDDAPVLRAGGPREAFCSTFAMPTVHPHATDVDVELAGGEDVAIGDACFHVLATPGHSPGSVCYLMERGGLRILFTGDFVVSLTEDAGPLCGLGTYTTYLPPAYRGDARAFLASLRKVKALPAPDLILPGHPEFDRRPQNPHLPAEFWRAMLEHGIQAMEVLVARYEADGANFLDGRPKQLLAGLYYLGDYGGSAVYWLNTPKRRFLFDAPGGPGLLDFLQAKLPAVGLTMTDLTAVLLTACDQRATAGLEALVARTRCRVVASDVGLPALRKRCPSGTVFIHEKDLEKSIWLPGRSLPLAGRGLAPVAYKLRWHDKTVLLSGRIPTKMTQQGWKELVRSLSEAGGDPLEYLQALRRLADVKPDIWLPAAPMDGQNANLYGQEWEEVIARNAQLVDQPLPR